MLHTSFLASNDLKLHLQGIDKQNEAWNNINQCFGKWNEIQDHQLENKSIALDPANFECIENYISRFKTMGLLLANCSMKKSDYQMIHAIFLNSVNLTMLLFLHFIPPKKPLELFIKSPVFNHFVIS